jgi:hypothetical protein
MLDDLLRAQWTEGRAQIARWLIDRGFPNAEPGKRFPFKTEDGGSGEIDLELYAAMTRGAGSRGHFAARALELIDRVLCDAESAPWRAIWWAHELGTLDGDARLAARRSGASAVAGQQRCQRHQRRELEKQTWRCRDRLS